MLIVALKNRYKAPARLARPGLARSSCFYHRARITLEDKYLPIRHTMKEALRDYRGYGYHRFRASMTRHTMLDAAVETIADSAARPIIQQRSGRPLSLAWLERTKAAKLDRSMSRKASSQDNAAGEGFFGGLKTEVFYPRDWRAFTVAQFIDEVDAYIHW